MFDNNGGLEDPEILAQAEQMEAAMRQRKTPLIGRKKRQIFDSADNELEKCREGIRL